MKIEKIVYQGKATSAGGREGVSRTSDGSVEVRWTTPKEMRDTGAVTLAVV
jgi:organic hydroperoxide reductase OsmC/OhrA